MTLEELLAPIKWTDEQIKKQYTKVSYKFGLEDGNKKYWLGLSTLFVSAPGLNTLSELYSAGIGPATFFTLCLVDEIHNIYGILKHRTPWFADTKTMDYRLYICKQHAKYSRFPAFAAGVGMFIQSGISLYDSLVNGEPFKEDTVYYAAAGLGFLATASSMYLKGTDRTLLSKRSPLEKLADWLYEKTAPAPKPVPIRD